MLAVLLPYYFSTLKIMSSSQGQMTKDPALMNGRWLFVICQSIAFVLKRV